MNRIYVPPLKKLKSMSLPQLDKLYWSLFSRWIRLKAADIRTGYIVCFICGKPVHWTNADTMHYIPRRHGATRFNLYNNHAGCVECNRYKDGNLVKYAKRLTEVYGEGTTERLEEMRNWTIKIDRHDYIEGILQVNKKLEAYERT